MRYFLLIMILSVACNQKPSKEGNIKQNNTAVLQRFEPFFKSYEDNIVAIDTISKNTYDGYRQNDLYQFLDTTNIIKKTKNSLRLPIPVVPQYLS